MNCLALEQDGEVLVVDCGVTFDDRGLGVDVIHADFSALEPYRGLFEILLVMTVEPGFGGQAFMADAAAKIRAARADRRLADGPLEVQVDGGINVGTAATVGALGVDVIIAGSVSDDEAKTIYPQGWKAPKPYIRIVPQPS